jgi:hypothetical protein
MLRRPKYSKNEVVAPKEEEEEEVYIYVHITIYLPHFSYVFRCATHHLQGGLLIFMLYEANLQRQQHC